MGTEISITGPERTRRFWRAHGTSPLHLTLLHAFGNNPATAWTPEGLSIWYGLSVDRVRDVLSEFAACGIVCRTAHPADAFVWTGAQDWAVPHDREPRAIVRDRWISQTCDSAAPPSGEAGHEGPEVRRSALLAGLVFLPARVVAPVTSRPRRGS